MKYFPDTNILADFGRDAATQQRLDRAIHEGASFVVAPPVFTELMRGFVTKGAELFVPNKSVFTWLHESRFEILALPKPFIAAQMKTTLAGPSGVQPKHYAELIEMVATANDFADFMKKTDSDGSNWKDMVNQPETQQHQLDKEFAALKEVAASGKDVAKIMCSWFGAPGCRPNHLILGQRFSAALEFLRSTCTKVNAGANPRENDPGLYIDFQLLLYLGDDSLSFLSNENFSHEIHDSPQRQRIVKLDHF